MKTDKLIDMLTKNLEPVKSEWGGKALAWAVVLGGIISFCVMLMTVGLRDDMMGKPHAVSLALKLLFVLSLIGVGTALLIKLNRPGQDGKGLFKLTFVPFLAAGLAAIVALAVQPSADWGPMCFGTHWVACLFCIPFFAIGPFAALIWALRKGAPTNLRRTGAIAGLVAGALGAAAYAFHCPDDSIPFVAIWYGAMLGFCAWIGAKLGPRLLRW